VVLPGGPPENGTTGVLGNALARLETSSETNSCAANARFGFRRASVREYPWPLGAVALA
jgi:hypothetical protein